VAAEVVREQPLTIYVNGEKFLTLLCSPMMLEALVVGYLWMEKVIGGVEEIARVVVSPVDGRADVTLTYPVTLPTERILTSGAAAGSRSESIIGSSRGSTRRCGCGRPRSPTA